MNIEHVIPIANVKSTRVDAAWFSQTVDELERTLPVGPIIEIGSSVSAGDPNLFIQREVSAALRRDGDTVLLTYGGDGTVNRVWQQVIDMSTADKSAGKIVLAHVVGGAINVNSRLLGIPPKESSVLRAFQQQQSISIDQQHAEITMADGSVLSRTGLIEFGFIGVPPFLSEYEKVRSRFSRIIDRVVIAAQRSLHKMRPQEVRVEQNGATIYERPTLLIETVNGPNILGKKLTGRTLTDGLMTVFMVPSGIAGEGLVRLALGYTALSLGNAQAQSIPQLETSDVVFHFPEGAVWHVDAEVGDEFVSRATVQVIPRSVPFLLPGR